MTGLSRLISNPGMKRILIADDSPATRQLVAAALSDSAQVELERASSGLEAIRLLSTEKVDLVLTDVNMPDINGLELIKFVKTNENLRHIPVVIISTDSSDRDMQLGLSLGASEYLPKPFTSEELLGVINRYL
jgi:two-component system, chemotaxis family, chemotaxis protein CheY